jgi:hypothetical protein
MFAPLRPLRFAVLNANIFEAVHSSHISEGDPVNNLIARICIGFRYCMFMWSSEQENIPIELKHCYPFFLPPTSWDIVKDHNRDLWMEVPHTYKLCTNWMNWPPAHFRQISPMSSLTRIAACASSPAFTHCCSCCSIKRANFISWRTSGDAVDFENYVWGGSISLKAWSW